MPRREATPQIPLLPSATPQISGGEIGFKNHKLKHAEILKTLQSAPDCRPFVQIYRQEVLSIKTRTIHLLGRKSSARISNTLLGFTALIWSRHGTLSSSRKLDVTRLNSRTILPSRRASSRNSNPPPSVWYPAPKPFSLKVESCSSTYSANYTGSFAASFDEDYH